MANLGRAVPSFFFHFNGGESYVSSSLYQITVTDDLASPTKHVHDNVGLNVTPVLVLLSVRKTIQSRGKSDRIRGNFEKVWKKPVQL